MRFVHTSDWHLGRSLHGIELLGYQAVFIDRLVDLVRTERPAAVLISGDIYDRAVPPVGAVALLEDALARLTELTHVIVISGNHDSATRLGFGAGLMRPEVTLATQLAGVGRAIELADPAGGPGALVYPIPFLDVYEAAPALSTEDKALPTSHEAVLGAAMDRVRTDLERRGLGHRDPASGGDETGWPDGGAVRPGGAGLGRADGTDDPAEVLGVDAGMAKWVASADAGRPSVVVMAHAFVTGGVGSESERDLTVGGVASAPAGVFAGADYAALGHLHGAQSVKTASDQVARYSGSPLAFSFSEAEQTKSVAMVTLGAGPPSVELVAMPVPRPLAVIAGTLAELESAAHDHLVDHWLKVTVIDPVRPDDLSARIRRRFAHLLLLEHAPEGISAERQLIKVTRGSSPAAVTAQFIEYAGGRTATAAELAEVEAALRAVMAGAPK